MIENLVNGIGSSRSFAKLLSLAILATWFLHQWDYSILQDTLRHIHDVSFLEDNLTSTTFRTKSTKRPLSINAMNEQSTTTVEPIIDVITPDKTRSMILGATYHNVSTQNLLFHVIHTTSEDNFGTMQKRCLESIFYHHPLATVMLHVKSMTDQPVQYLIQAGYDIQLDKYDVVENLKQLEGEDIVDTAILQDFMNSIDAYASDQKGYWYANESNLLRTIIMYYLGGIYLGM